MVVIRGEAPAGGLGAEPAKKEKKNVWLGGGRSRPPTKNTLIHILTQINKMSDHVKISCTSATNAVHSLLVIIINYERQKFSKLLCVNTQHTTHGTRAHCSAYCIV